MDPPLVVSDDDAGTPLLLSGPMVDEENESSQMMALLMQRPEIEPSSGTEALRTQQQQPEFSLVTVAAATLALLSSGLVWGSYLSDSWSDTHLLTSIGWQEKYLPFLDDYTDAIIQTVDLGSIVSILRASKEFVLLAVVAITAVGIPCLSIIINPMAVTKQYYKTYMGASYWDLVLRFSLVIIHLLVILDLATGVTLELTDTAFRVQNCMRGSMLCYLLGMTAAIGVVSVLRYGQVEAKQPQTLTRIPPAAAFRHPWPNIVVEAYDDDESEASSASQGSKWYLCFTWQLGLAAGVLFLPSFSLPLLRISYKGLAAEFIYTTSREIYLWQLPQLLWRPCKDNEWMVVVCELILIFQAVVIPLVGLLCGLVMLRASPLSKQDCRRWLSCLHPAMNGITFALTVVLFAPGLESMTSYLLNEDSSGFCEKFDRTLGEPCLTVSGSSLPGAWFFMLQSVLLEVFCVMALSSTKERSSNEV